MGILDLHRYKSNWRICTEFAGIANTVRSAASIRTSLILTARFRSAAYRDFTGPSTKKTKFLRNTVPSFDEFERRRNLLQPRNSCRRTRKLDARLVITVAGRSLRVSAPLVSPCFLFAFFKYARIDIEARIDIVATGCGHGGQRASCSANTIYVYEKFSRGTFIGLASTCNGERASNTRSPS